MAEPHHILRINDTRAALVTNLDNHQIAITTDNITEGYRALVYADGLGNFREVAIQDNTATFTDVDITLDLTMKTGSTLQHDDFTTGSVIFYSGVGFNEKNAGLFFDSTVDKLGIGTNVVSEAITLNGDIEFTNDSLTRTIDAESVTTGDGVAINITGGETTFAGEQDGGAVTIKGGPGPDGSASGGDVVLQGGSGGSEGDIKIGNGAANTAFVFVTGGEIRLDSVSGSAIKVNRDKLDVDFIVSGDNVTDLIHCDAANDTVGIGIAAPDRPLSVDQTTSGLSSLLLTNSGSTPGSGNFGAGISWTTLSSIQQGSSERARFVSVQTDTDNDRIGLAFFTHPSDSGGAAPVEAMRIKHDGNVGINDTVPLSKLDVTGDINTTDVYKVDDIQVVSNQETGWTAATGTATRTTFVTGTVTLPQLAERVKALIDDLGSTSGHGLIDA